MRSVTRQREEEDVPAARQRPAAFVDEARERRLKRGGHRGERVLALDARELPVVNEQVRNSSAGQAGLDSADVTGLPNKGCKRRGIEGAGVHVVPLLVGDPGLPKNEHPDSDGRLSLINCTAG